MPIQDRSSSASSGSCVTALMASGMLDSSFKFHLTKAKENGVTKTEIAEALTQLAFYAGWPKAWSAFRMAMEVWTGEETAEEFAKASAFPLGEPNDAFAKYFTGKSYLSMLTQDGLGTAHVSFAPGCRNWWHIHHGGGQILLVTGVGGSLGAVIEQTGLADLLGGLFTVGEGVPVVVSILLAWFIAALLHLAIGSVSVAAITAGGILAPIVGSLPVAPVVIGLAVASGAMFALQVNSNFFWMFKGLLGLTTQGALKTMTTVTSIGSLISLPLVMVAALIPL